MIPYSQSYADYKRQSQETIDFIYLCCHAMPSLNAYIKAVEHGAAPKLPDADYFKNEPEYSRLRKIKSNYKKVLGDSLTISIFSYFESYIFDVIKEIFEFQQQAIGKDLSDFAREQRDLSFTREDTDYLLKNSIKKLRSKPKSSKADSYHKSLGQVRKTQYFLPSQLFAFFGIQQLQSNLKSYTAKDIPMLMKDVFGFSLTLEEEKTFEKIRGLRNDVAHGDVPAINLREAMQYNKFLKQLAAKFDFHLCRFFFVIEAYNLSSTSSRDNPQESNDSET